MIIPAHFALNDGASEAAIAAAQLELGRALPSDYLDFMRISDGGESGNGPILILWEIAEVPGWSRAYLKYSPFEDSDELLLFGSNGGGELFGFDWNADGAIVEPPAIGMERDQLLHCADTFTEFLKNPTGFK